MHGKIDSQQKITPAFINENKFFALIGPSVLYLDTGHNFTTSKIPSVIKIDILISSINQTKNKLFLFLKRKLNFSPNFVFVCLFPL